MNLFECVQKPREDQRIKHEVAAPGTNIVASGALGGRPNPQAPNERFPVRVTMSGTSMSSPHVSGVVALMLQKNPQLSTDQIKQILITSARPPIGVQPFDIAWGFGKVDASEAVRLVE